MVVAATVVSAAATRSAVVSAAARSAVVAVAGRLGGPLAAAVVAATAPTAAAGPLSSPPPWSSGDAVGCPVRAGLTVGASSVAEGSGDAGASIDGLSTGGDTRRARRDDRAGRLERRRRRGDALVPADQPDRAGRHDAGPGREGRDDHSTSASAWARTTAGKPDRRTPRGRRRRTRPGRRRTRPRRRAQPGDACRGRHRLGVDRGHDPVDEVGAHAGARPAAARRAPRARGRRDVSATRSSGARPSTPAARRGRTRRAVAGHRSVSSSTRRRRARPRWRCVFTVPRGRSVASAISASERSAKKRSATTSRYGSSSAATAARSWASRSERRTRVAGSTGRRAGDRAWTLARRVDVGGDRVEPGDLLALGRAPDREPHGDPRQPRPERTVAPPRWPATGRRSRRPPGRRPRPRRGRRGCGCTPRSTDRPSRSTRPRKASRSPRRTASTTLAVIERRSRVGGRRPGQIRRTSLPGASRGRRVSGHRAEPGRVPTP